VAPSNGLSGGRRLALLVLPWLFLVVFAYLYLTALLPRALSGHLLGICVGLFVAMVLVTFTIAALTFSRDVLSGKYP
jgi:hypothetical protein